MSYEVLSRGAVASRGSAHPFFGSLGADEAEPAMPAGMPPLPTIRSADDAKAFVLAQAKKFATKEMADAAASARKQVLAKFNVDLPPGVAMAAEQAGQWADKYIAEHGIPDSPKKLVKMGGAFVLANSSQMGASPEMLAAIDLVLHMPKNLDQGKAWVESLGKRYAAQYGIPLDGEGIAKASARAACTNFGVDPRIVDVGISVFADGKLDGKDAETITIVVASMAGAAAFSALGIPAPIGSMIGSFVGEGLVYIAKDLFGPDDLTRQQEAYEKALVARDVRQAQCQRAGVEAWNAYNQYWDASVTKILNALASPSLSPLIARAGGVRFFGAVYDPNDLLFQHYCLRPGFKNEPDPDGCLYYCTSKWDPTRRDYFPACEAAHCEARYTPGVTQLSSISSDLSTPYCDADGHPVVVWPVDRAWQDFHKVNSYRAVTLSPGGKVDGRIDPYALLHYWFAERIPVFPAPSATPASRSVDMIIQSASIPDPYVKPGGPQYDCATPGSIAVLSENVQRLGKASAFVMQDILKTAAWQAARDAALATQAAEAAAARASTQLHAQAAAASIAQAAATYAQGLTPAQLQRYQACIRAAPRSAYASCRAAAGGSPIEDLATAASASAARRVARSRRLGRWLLGIAAVTGAAYLVHRSTARSAQQS